MIITKESTGYYAKKNAGGKGYNLYLLSRQGVPVPKWAVISATIYEQLLAENSLAEKIQERIAQDQNPKTLSEDITTLILSQPLSPQIEAAIVSAYEGLSCGLIAVRSSAIGEDSAEFSFAGQLSSYLYIRDKEHMLDSVRACWASAYTERGISYRIQNKLGIDNIKVAVVLQEMIDSEKSGVLFTCDPVKGTPETCFVNSVFGVGEGLVSGALEGDTYVVDKKTFAVQEQIVAEKKQKMVQDSDAQSCKLVDLAENLQETSTLDPSELKALCQAGRDIENFYDFPQDIEWAFKDGQLFILQARPVTTPVTNGRGFLYLWDNSNIVESYGGLTLPLTFDFARYVYHSVYVQFCEILLIPPKQIREMDYFLRNMLGVFYGRVYYNLLNWYKLTSILPGFKYNRGFMETMMGTNESLEDEIADRIKPPSSQETFGSKVRRFITGLKFFYFHITAQGLVDGFLKNFYQKYEGFKALNFNEMTPHQIIEHYYEMERVFLNNWKAPIINDFLCMVHFGILKKLVEKHFSQFGDSFQNDLLAGDGNLESALPTKEVLRMSFYVRENPELRTIIEKTPTDQCLEALRQSRFTEFYQDVLSYIDKYGFRCMSEMKLEQRDLHHSPDLLFVFIKNNLSANLMTVEAIEAREKKIRQDAEQKAMSNISGLSKLVFKWSLKHARRAVRNRENTRFCRTRVYGIVRKMFYAIGAHYTTRGIIEQDGDIFYLTLPELFGSLEGFASITDFKGLVALRKAEYERYADMFPDPRFGTRGPVYWQNNHMPSQTEVEIDDSDLPENCLKGIPCCAGTIEGKVKVIMSPDDDLTLNGEILVTKRTDPGWVPLYPSASALLVERGGLLSHSAIVAREMGLPTIVSIKNLTDRLETGMTIRMNGETGLIEIL